MPRYEFFCRTCKKLFSTVLSLVDYEEGEILQSANRPSPFTLHQRTRIMQPHFHVNGWELPGIRSSIQRCFVSKGWSVRI